MRHAWIVATMLLAPSLTASEGLTFGRAQRSVSSPRDAGFIPASANGDDSRAAELARIRTDGDDFTLYELLAPDSHRFAITYDVTTAKEGDRFFLNPIREGSIASDERVVDQASGKPLKWEIVTGKQGRDAGLLQEAANDQARFVKVELAGPVPKDGERRIRIFKTYTDPKSYSTEGDRIVFERGLFIRRNAVLLPAGYELVSCTVPAIVSTEKDGRVKASFLNDRDDALPVKIVGRRLPGGAK
jgi:hypothetical protein